MQSDLSSATLPAERSAAIADHYGMSFSRAIAPSDARYPMQILSLLSDAQHVDGLDEASEANAYVNAAKVMLTRMVRAAEEGRA
jgi:hypothetical protein